MTGFEKSTLRWAKTAVIMSGLAAFFVCAQWWEMHEGGVDTHNLATAAGTQATQATNLATAAATQATAAKNFSQSAGNIDAKIGQAEADFGKMAKNSEESLKATQEAMRRDQRAWVGITGVQRTSEFAAGKNVEFEVLYSNTGKTPGLETIFTDCG